MRQVLEPMFIYFDTGRHWSTQQGLAVTVLCDMCYFMELPGILASQFGLADVCILLGCVVSEHSYTCFSALFLLSVYANRIVSSSLLKSIFLDVPYNLFVYWFYFYYFSLL